MGAIALFTRKLLSNFTTVGEIMPYSNQTAQKVVLHGNVANAKSILEIGPGLGSLTKEILKSAQNGANIIAVEKLEEFVEYLDENCKDRRLKLILGDIFDQTTLSKLRSAKFDTIVSSIPLSFQSIEQRENFSKIIRDLLKQDGIFINAQYSLRSKRFFERDGFRCDWDIELANLPPVFIHVCRKA